MYYLSQIVSYMYYLSQIVSYMYYFSQIVSYMYYFSQIVSYMYYLSLIVSYMYYLSQIVSYMYYFSQIVSYMYYLSLISLSMRTTDFFIFFYSLVGDQEKYDAIGLRVVKSHKKLFKKVNHGAYSECIASGILCMYSCRNVMHV